MKLRLLRPLIVCGQRSLEVFCVGLLLSFLGHFLLELTAGSLFTQILVSLAGIGLMTGVAYDRSWAKKLEKRSGTLDQREMAGRMSSDKYPYANVDNGAGHIAPIVKPDQRVEETASLIPRFNENGLIPAIATDAASGTVLMLAWMNSEALVKTIETAQAW